MIWWFFFLNPFVWKCQGNTVEVLLDVQLGFLSFPVVLLPFFFFYRLNEREARRSFNWFKAWSIKKYSTNKQDFVLRVVRVEKKMETKLFWDWTAVDVLQICNDNKRVNKQSVGNSRKSGLWVVDLRNNEKKSQGKPCSRRCRWQWCCM